MKYIEIVNFVFSIIFGIFGLLTLHFAVLGILGLFKKKKYPKTEVRNRYGVVIPARNEETVVGELLNSILKSDYPQDKLEIFVIAHNCTDKTAEIARSYGKNVHVYELNNPSLNTKGLGLQYLFKQIDKEYGIMNFDGFVFFDADNIATKDFLTRMNEAFEYYNKQSIITSYRNCKNFDTSLISGLYGLHFAISSIYACRGRTDVGCSSRVNGTGFIVPAIILKDGWNYLTITEDLEFTADQVMANNKIKYCDDAVVYDEQPTNIHIMWRQRVRWSRGKLIVFYHKLGDLIKHLFVKDNKDRFSSYDIMTNVLPTCLNVFILTLLQILFLSIAPLIDSSITFHEIFLTDNLNFFTSQGYLMSSLRSLAMYYLVTLFQAVSCFIAAGEKAKNISIFKKIILCILWPFFIFIQLPIDIQALFSKNLGWKTIPHGDKGQINA